MLWSFWVNLKVILRTLLLMLQNCKKCNTSLVSDVVDSRVVTQDELCDFYRFDVPKGTICQVHFRRFGIFAWKSALKIRLAQWFIWFLICRSWRQWGECRFCSMLPLFNHALLRQNGWWTTLMLLQVQACARKSAETALRDGRLRCEMVPP